mgnify:CR=1 FL=1
MGFLSVVANGLSMGAIYGLIALGLTLIFGIMRIINFAQGALLMLSMMVSYWLWAATGINPYILVIIVGPIMFAVGYICERCLIKPVLDEQKDVREPVAVLLLTAALAIVLENAALMVFGAYYSLGTGYGERCAVLWLDHCLAGSGNLLFISSPYPGGMQYPGYRTGSQCSSVNGY